MTFRKNSVWLAALSVVCLFLVLTLGGAYEYLPTSDEHMWVWCYGTFCTQPRLEDDIAAFGVKNYDFSWISPNDFVDWRARADLCSSPYFDRTCSAYENVLQDSSAAYSTFTTCQKAFTGSGNLFYVYGINSLYDGFASYETAVSHGFDSAIMQDMQAVGLQSLDEVMSFTKSEGYVSPKDLYLDFLGINPSLAKDEQTLVDFKGDWSNYLSNWWGFVTSRSSYLSYDDECREVVESEGTGMCNFLSLTYIARILQQSLGIVPAWTVFNERLCTISVCFGSASLSTSPVSVAGYLNILKSGSTLGDYSKKHIALVSFINQAFREETAISLSAQAVLNDLRDETQRLATDELLEELDDALARQIYELATSASAKGRTVRARTTSYFSPESTLEEADAALTVVEARLQNLAGGAGEYSPETSGWLYNRIAVLVSIQRELEDVQGILTDVITQVAELEALEDEVILSQVQGLREDKTVLANPKLSLDVAQAYEDFLTLQEEQIQPHVRKTRLGERVLEKYALILLLESVRTRAEREVMEEATALGMFLFEESERIQELVEIASSPHSKTFSNGRTGEEVVLGNVFENSFSSWQARLANAESKSVSAEGLLEQYTHLYEGIRVIESGIYQKVDARYAASVNQHRRELLELTHVVEETFGTTNATRQSNTLLEKYNLTIFASGDGWISAKFALGFMKRMSDEFSSTLSTLLRDFSIRKHEFMEGLDVESIVTFAETPVAGEDALIDQWITVRNPSTISLDDGETPVSYTVPLEFGRTLSKSLSTNSNIISASRGVELLSSSAGSNSFSFQINPPFDEYSSKNLRLLYLTNPLASSTTTRETTHASSTQLFWTQNASLECFEDLDSVALRLNAPFNLEEASVEAKSTASIAAFAYEVVDGDTLLLTKEDGCLAAVQERISVTATLNDPIQIVTISRTATTISQTHIQHEVRFSATNVLTTRLEDVWLVLPALLPVQPRAMGTSISGVSSSNLLFGEDGTLSWLEQSFSAGQTKDYTLVFTTQNITPEHILSLDEDITRVLDDIQLASSDCGACCNISQTLESESSQFLHSSNQSTPQELIDAFVIRQAFLEKILKMLPLITELSRETKDLKADWMSGVLADSCNQDFEQALKSARAAINAQEKDARELCQQVKASSKLAVKLVKAIEERIDRLKDVLKLYPAVILDLSSTNVTPSQLGVRAESLKNDALLVERDCNEALLHQVEADITDLEADTSTLEEAFSQALFYFVGGSSSTEGNISNALLQTVPQNIVQSVESERAGDLIMDASLWEELMQGQDVVENQEFLNNYQSGDFDAAIASAARKGGLVKSDYLTRLKAEARIQLSLADAIFNKVSAKSAQVLSDAMNNAQSSFEDGRFLDCLYWSLYIQQEGKKLLEQEGIEIPIKPLLAVFGGILVAVLLVRFFRKKDTGTRRQKRQESGKKKHNGKKKLKAPSITVFSEEFGEIR